MKALLVLSAFLILGTVSCTIQSWNQQNGPNALPVPKLQKMSQEEADSYMMDIFFKLQDRDSNLTAIIQELDTVLRLAPNVPKNTNLTLMLAQMEQVVKKNLTALLKLNIKMKTWNNPDVETGLVRYKRSNETYQNCITVCNAIGTYGGGSIGASVLGSLLSIIPVIGTVIGAYLGARLGADWGKKLSNVIATAWCPK